MIIFKSVAAEELEGRLKGRIAELEKINKELHAEPLDHTCSEESLKEAYDSLEAKVKEITAELEKSYNLLKESEMSLAETQRMAHIGNWSRDIATGEVYWSDEVYRIFGFKPQEFGVTYDAFLSFVHPDDKEYVIKATKHVLKGEISFDYRVVRNGGEERTVHEEVKVVFNDRGVPFQVRGTVQDITERKRAEQEFIRAKEELAQRVTDKYLMLFNSIDEGYALCEVIYDTDGKADDVRFLEVNPALGKLSGLEDVPGKTVRQLIPTIESIWIESASRVVKTGESFRFEGYVEGLGRWVDVHFSRIGNETSHTIVIVFNNVTERKLAESMICRYNRVLEGINRIFSNIVQAKTEEEVGNACISVALEVTGSEFGFINEMGSDGLLHDVAKSEMAWEQCFMHDKTEHRLPPKDFAVHGLYGSVITNEKGFFTNDPPSHPDSLGLPPGHPPITSILCVPLVQEGNIVGLIAVANRENGYSSEQQEDLEAIASAVMQALNRKKEEKERERVEEALRRSEETARKQLTEIENLYRNAPVGLCELDHELRYVRINERLAEYHGFPVSAHIGKQIRDIIPQIAYSMEPKMRHILETGEPLLDIEIVGKTFSQPDIERSWLERWLPIFDARGLVTGLNVLVEETTERKKMEKELKLARDYNRSLIEASLDPLVTIGLDGKITDVNNATEQITGYSRNELIGTDFSYYFTEAEKARKGYQQAFIHGKVHDYPLEIQHRDGHINPVLYNASVYKNEYGEIIGVFAAARDITELKKVEKELELASKYNRSLIEASLDPLVTIGPDGKITDVNEATESVTGYSRKELIGTDFSSYFTEPEKAKEGYKLVFREGLVRDYALEIQHREGHITPVLYNASVYRDEDGEVIGIFAAARDVTEHKRAEKALKLANAYNRSLIEASVDPLVTIGPDGKITDVNNSTESITGYSRKELIGTDFSDYFTEPEKARKGYQHVFQNGLVRNYPLEIRHREGQIIPVLYNASVYRDENGEVIGIFAAARDITELKKAEEKIQTLANVVESSNDAIITESLDGIITSWNKGAEQVYGYSAEEVLGKNMSILEPDSLKGEIKQLAGKVKQGKKIQHHETLRVKKDGTILNISATLSPVYNVSGKLVAISNIAGDITEKKISENLLHEKQMAEVANRTKNEFLANMSHELRTPLNSIIGFSDMLYEQAYGELNRKQLRAIGNISNSGKHLLNLINGILDLSKIEANKMELNYREFDLATKLDLIRNVLYPVADKKNIDIELDIDSKLTRICADEDKFTRIIYNLVDNAIKFSYENSHVKIGAIKKGDLVEITVKDTGIGIKAEDQHKLFKPFSQVNSFSSRKFQGTGLGLSLVKQIVNLHGGYVWFRSEQGEGSTFAFAIPIALKAKVLAYCH